MSQTRLDRFRTAMAEHGHDAILITDPLNRRHLTGHSGGDHGLAESGGVVLISNDEAILLADRNNIAWVKSEADPAFEAQAWERPWVKSVAKIAAERGWKTIGFEDGAMLVSTHRALADELGPERALIPIGSAASRLRASKDEDELAILRRAIALTDRVFVEVTSQLTPGITERELANRFDEGFRAGGAEGSGFSTTVASGPNSARPHHASGDRVIQANEPIIIDMGAVVGGYTADLTRTIWLGEPTERFRTVYNSVSRAQAAALARVRAGEPLASVDRAARESLAADGFEANVIHSVGHGIGLAIHEAPSVSITAEGSLEAGQVITVEPGIYFPDWGGVRIEDVVVVTPDGYELLSAAPK
jgi:Xaa-Pro aminopeptidase